MFSLSSSHQFHLYKSACDMRKSFDSLCGIVQNELNQVAHNGSVYVFINRRGNQIKLLYWETGGFVLYYKRLEQGTFAFPVHNKTQITWCDLVLMIEEIQVIKSNQKRRFSIK
ncbi:MULTISPECIES: IS66 family insertion sequence element accessory protein TnpB [unclassified Myroides]|uniref:IS66 family insertion sequence element accessory protein TnpB n=1 Tax=unclassified Myroides TaxID=2642485 RepID=UPI00310171C2